MTDLEMALLKTLAYADLFYFPLKFEELGRFLISSRTLSADLLLRGVDQLVAAGKVGQESGYYFLSGQNSLVKIRREREIISRKKIASAARILKLIGLWPDVKLVSLTGALSYYNSRVGDDVDVMVITSPGRLWLTRLAVFLLLKLLGRKQNEKRPARGDRLCVNLWSDSENLAVPDGERDLVVASDIGHLRPVVNKNQTYEKFIEANLWLKTFLPNWKR